MTSRNHELRSRRKISGRIIAHYWLGKHHLIRVIFAVTLALRSDQDMVTPVTLHGEERSGEELLSVVADNLPKPGRSSS
jgi:hypothetical protein